MVCSKAVNGVQVFPKGLHVFASAQHGAHLTPTFPNTPEVFLAEKEVMGSHLTGHLNALLLCCFDDQDL